MTLVAYVKGDDRAHAIRLNDLGLSTRADGTVGFGGIIFDDPDGTLDIKGYQQVEVHETECVDAPILFSGFIGPRRYQRQATNGTYRSGVSRWIDTDLVDQNYVASNRLIVNPDGSRPAESHNARINWLLASDYAFGLFIDDGQVDASHPRPMDKADYRDQYPADVLNDIAAPIGKQWFIYVIQPTGEYGLFFANPTTFYGASALSISNDMADSSDVCLYPYIDPVLARDPSEVISLIRYHAQNIIVMEGRLDTLAAFFTDTATGGLNLSNRGKSVTNTRIGSEASARIMADGILEKFSEESDTITCKVRLPAAQAGLIQAGQFMQIKLTHATNEGYGDFVYVRVNGLVLEQTPGTNKTYDLSLELSNTRGIPNGGGGGGAPGGNDFPHPPPAPPAIVQDKFGLLNTGGGGHVFGTLTMDAPPSAGNWLVAFIGSRGTVPTLASGWTEHPHGLITPGSDNGRMVYREVGVGEPADVALTTVGGTRAEVWEVNGIDGTLDTSSFADVDTGTQPASINAGTLSPTSGVPAIMFMGLLMHCSDWSGNGPTTMSTPAGWTTDGEYEVTVNGELHPNVQADSRIEASTTGTYGTSSTIAGAGFNFGGWGGLALVFAGSAAVNPTPPGDEVPTEVPTYDPDGPAYTFKTLGPFADQTLRVYVNRLDQTAAVLAYDGLCGTFQLAFDPLAKGWLLEVRYVGR
jgi:hypothetical protein